MEIKNYRFSLEETNSYLLLEDTYGILIDPCSELLVNIIKKSGVELEYVCLTHEHCDHLWGMNQIRKVYGCPLIATTAASLAIQSPKTNRAKEHHIYMTLRFGSAYAQESGAPDYFCEKAEIEYEDRYCLEWHGNRLFFKCAPGHSEGSCIIKINDNTLIVGDTLLKGEKTFTRFEGGNEKMLRSNTLPYIRTFSENIRILPGHGEEFLLKDYPFNIERE